MDKINIGGREYVKIYRPKNIFILREHGMKEIHPFHIKDVDSIKIASAIKKEDDLAYLVYRDVEIFVKNEDYAYYKKTLENILNEFATISRYNEGHKC